MKHGIQICSQDKENMKRQKRTHKNPAVATYCIDVAIIIIQKNFCLTCMISL